MISSSSHKIDYDDAAHVYKIGGRRIPNVTGVLSGAGVVDVSWFTDEARERGRRVHSAAHYLDENDLNWAHLEANRPEIVPYIRAYELFKKQTGFKPLLIEHKIFHPTYFYAGRLDRLGEMRGRVYLIDLKSGAVEHWAGVQLAGYLCALCVEYPELAARGVSRAAVQLNNDGSYKLHAFDDYVTDKAVFLAALTLSNWQKNKKVGV